MPPKDIRNFINELKNFSSHPKRTAEKPIERQDNTRTTLVKPIVLTKLINDYDSNNRQSTNS